MTPDEVQEYTLIFPMPGNSGMIGSSEPKDGAHAKEMKAKLTVLFVAWEDSHAAASDLAAFLHRLMSSEEARDNFLGWPDEFIQSRLFACDGRGNLVHDIEGLLRCRVEKTD